MRIPESQLEELLARCLDADDAGYQAELERLCAASPDAAAALRARIAQLEKLGFLGQPAANGAPQWLPDHVGRYWLRGLLGRGGMGVVFRGQADGDDAEVAIKLVRPDLLADPRARERFRREALLAARLSHPGICPVLEVGIDDDVPFLVMPLLQGSTFGAWLREQPRDRNTVLAVLEGHARALHAAHEAGLVHRDVTPGNLFVTTDGRSVVLDFGLARDTTGEVATLTMSQEMLGTLPYMAPEQIRGGRIDRRTDVYALGVVTYEALAGRLPFVARSRVELSRLVLDGDAPRLGKVALTVSRPLERVVQTAMDADPARRFATALDFAVDLARLRAGEPVSAHGVGPVLRARRWAGHHPVVVTALLLLIVLLGVAGAFVVRLATTVRVQHASEQALASRMLEQADPMRAIEQAIAAHEGQPSPMTLGQLNRLLHQVNMLATLPVQAGPVRRLAVHRIDEQQDRLAVASESGLSLLLVDRRTGALQPEQCYPVPAEVLLRCVSFSPDGRWVACGGTGKMAFVARVGEATLRPLRGSKGEVFAVEADDEGNVHGADVWGRLLYWPAVPAVAEGRELCNWRRTPVVAGSEPNVRGMRSGPGGDLLLWNQDYSVRVQRDGTEVWHTEPFGSGTSAAVAVIDAPRQRVLLGQLGRMRLVRWADGKVIWWPKLPSPMTDCALADDGTVASLHRDGTLRFWNGGPSPIAEYRDARDRIGAVYGVPGVDCFLAVGRGGTTMRLDTRGGVERAMAGGDIERWGLPGPFAWTTDGSVLLAGGGPGRVRSWDFDGSRAAPQTRFVGSPPIGISLHPDGKGLIVYTDDQCAWVWNPGQPPERLQNVPLTYYCRNGAAPGERVVIGGRVGIRQGQVAVFDAGLGSFRVPFQYDERYGIVGVAGLLGDRLLVAAGDNRWSASRIDLFDASGTEVAFDRARIAGWEVPITMGMVTCMDADREGSRVAFGCVGGGLHVWEVADDGRPPRSVAEAATNGRVWSIDMSADGRFVVAGIEDGSVLRWQPDSGAPEVLVAPRGRPARCALADNDRLVVEFAPDGLVRLWDAKQVPARALIEIAAGDGAVVRDAVLLRSDAPGGLVDWRTNEAALRLATVTSDGWVRIWSLDGEAVLRKARARLDALEVH